MVFCGHDQIQEPSDIGEDESSPIIRCSRIVGKVAIIVPEYTTLRLRIKQFFSHGLIRKQIIFYLKYG
jgi:hypothetical protein